MSKKKNIPENMQKLKKQLESGNNLIDYFLVCGINPSMCLEKKLFNLTDSKIENLGYLSKILKPQIISKFPQFDNNNDTIDEEIITYCFPNGFKPYYNDKSPILGTSFSIILDNNLFSSDYPQKYLTCLLFYEKLSQYKSLADDIEKIKNDLDISDCRSTLFDKSLMINNPNRSSIKQQIKKNNDPKTLTHHKISSDAFGKKNSDLISQTILDKLNNNLNSTVENKALRLTIASSSLTNKMKNYYIPKCICIVSIHPYIELFKEILFLIYKYTLSSQNQPIEKIIANLLIEVPIAPRGLYSIDFMILNKKMTLKRTENNKLLLSEINLKKFHKNVQFNIQIEVFKHILFSSKIIFFSKNINNLSETILAFISLLFPFKYPFQVTSYLNKNAYFILESISPFIIGINEKYDAQFFAKNDISTEGMDIFVVDLDNNLTELITNETFPEMPNKIVNNLEKELRKLDEEEKKKVFEIDGSFAEFNSKFQEIYFNFFCELIKNYDEYLDMNYFKNADKDIVTSIETLFFCNQFIKSHSSSDIPFYTKFVNDSQLFVDFIYRRMIPKNNQEIIELLLVNDTFTKMKNKSKFFGKDTTDFLDCNDYKITNKYIVPNPRELTEPEKRYIKENKDKLSEKGQIISERNKIKNDIISFKYNIFPELDFDIYCNNENANEYCLPPDYSEEIEAININAISKSSLGEGINRSLEMKNYLYLSWLEVWAFSFWYTDIKERPFRFNQMLTVLGKVKHHEMNILNLLFDALNKVSENEMILKLYRKILDLNINPSSFIYNIVSGVIDKAQMRLLKDKKKSSEIKYCPEDNYLYTNVNLKDNKKRTFLSLDDDLEIDTKLKFFSEFSCIQCGEKINLLNVCRTFNDVKNDILWVPCICGEYNLPKLKVIFGRELLRDPLYKTSSTDEIVLHSPYNLKINIKSAVMNNYGTKLNVLDFKIQFKALFWDFIWYCKIHSLDYNIILPYLKDIEELQVNYNNSSNDVFEIIFNDKIYKENLNRISKHSKTIYDTYYNRQKKINNSDKYIVEQKITFRIINKARMTLKNININEDEEDESEENDENSDENENNEKNEEMEKNKEEEKQNDKEIKEEISKDEVNNNNINIEKKNEEEKEKEKEKIEINNNEDNKIIREEKNKEQINIITEEEENDNSKELEEENKKSEENKKPKELEEENNSKEQIKENGKGEEEDNNKDQNNKDVDDNHKDENLQNKIIIEEEKLENNKNKINNGILEDKSSAQEEKEEEIKKDKEIIIEEEIKKDEEIVIEEEIKKDEEIPIENNIKKINKIEDKNINNNTNISKKKHFKKIKVNLDIKKGERCEVENSMQKILEKAKNIDDKLINNKRKYSNKLQDDNFLLKLKKELKKINDKKNNGSNQNTINYKKKNNNNDQKNIDPNMDYEE